MAGDDRDKELDCMDDQLDSSLVDEPLGPRKSRALLFASWLHCGMAMDQEMFLKMAAMTEAATKAATAAETALASLAGGSGGASSSSSSMQTGLQAASKILRNPEPYDGSDPHSFMTWKFVSHPG